MIATFKKAQWIAQQMEASTNVDDVYDVLLGNITEPSRFVAEVESYEQDYETEFRSRNARIRDYGSVDKD